MNESLLDGAVLSGADLDGAYLLGVRLTADTRSEAAHWGLPAEFHEARFAESAQIFRALGRHFNDKAFHHGAVMVYVLEMTALHLGAIGAERAPVGALRDRFASWWSCRPGLRGCAQWLGWSAHRWLWGYGVSPIRVLGWIAAVIVLFGLVVFPVVGVEHAGRTSHALGSGLALSIVTFATLGYGNRVPVGGVGEFLGGVEAVVGALLLSVFLVSLATRYVHRA